MSKVIVILLDGLRADTAQRCMSYLHALCIAGLSCHTELTALLPPLSRPIYATLLSGLSPLDTGIVRNEDTRLCPVPTIFHKAQLAGLVTAAAAYSWFSELCNRTPFDPGRDRLTQDPALPISYGLFYSQDDYPDRELFHDAEALRLAHKPQLLLVHSMGIDWAGHQNGGRSTAYNSAVRMADGLLAKYIPRWLTDGYVILVTSDHGMDRDGGHYDVTDSVRCVPLWLVGSAWKSISMPQDQTQLAGSICTILGLPGLRPEDFYQHDRQILLC